MTNKLDQKKVEIFGYFIFQESVNILKNEKLC